ncbi:MAG: two pore domain potassium channel family protein [Flavobacteriales bacterium]|nr:two pore domain potassium channel family protein [Flavobacteriales bacterium]
MNLNSHYTVEKNEESFVVNSILTAPKTALVKYFDRDGDQYFTMKYGVVEPHYIYEKIKNGDEIDVTHCYIHDFSLSKYREKYGLEERENVSISNFKADGAFFDNSSVIDFSFAVFEKDANFHETHFGKGTVYFFKSAFKGLVNFSEAYFGKGDADFQFTDFGDGDVTFEKSRFHYGNISFVNCVFGKGNTNFKKVIFNDGKVDFHFSRFGEGVKIFDQSVFGGGDVDFKRCDFGPGKADFRRIKFGDGDVTFEESIFTSGKVSFKSSDFGDGVVNFHMVDFGVDSAIFDNVKFGSGSVSFYKSISKELSFIECELDTFVNLRVTKCGYLGLTNSINRDIIELPNSRDKSDVKIINFAGMRNLGQLYLGWKESDIFNLITRQKEKTTNRQKSEQFRILRENFHNLGQYDDEDYAYVEFKRHELRAKTEDAITENPANKFWALPRSAFEYFIFDKIGLYATNPLRVLFSTAMIYTAFSLTYFILPHFEKGSEIVQSVSHPGGAGELSHLESAFYHSAVTFLTIGYGDYFPTGFFRILSAVEGWVGVFLMSYFTVAFVRKILR